jgi:MBG domain
MTGPRTSTVHPLPRRPWLLLPFLASVAFLSLGCSDQPTEPITPTKPVAAVVSHPVRKPAGSRISASQSAAPKPLVSFSVAQAISGTGPRVLVLADSDLVTTSALATSLVDAGLQVTLRPGPEHTWDGTNPSLDDFDAVVHLDGANYNYTLTDAGQNARASFVSNGGGYVGAQWNGFQDQPQMANLVLQSFGGDAVASQMCGACDVTYQAVPTAADHPVLAGLPSTFSFTADGHDAGPQIEFATNPSTVLMRIPNGAPAVLVREYGAGRVVSFSFAPNYYWNDSAQVTDPVMLQNPVIQRLYLNAVQWTAGASAGKTTQNITFDPLENKVYGDPAFALGATASSGLPVSYNASGSCEVVSGTLTITGAGSCTITAHQAGNEEFEPAADVSRSFFIAKAPATISLSGLSYTFDGTVKSATVTTTPAGLSGVSVTYSQSGAPAVPRNAGSYQVLASLDNANYEASPASATLTISKANPVISWTPASITVGTPLGSAQLNATFRGLGGVSLSGGSLYTPDMGTSLPAGPATLSVQFTPDDANYEVGNRSVSITVLSGMRFSGFYAPLKNMPAVNVVNPGSTVPIKFSVGGYLGLQILSGTPTSIPAQCGSGPEYTILPMPVIRDGLTAAGYSYTYAWRTDASWAGSCRKLIITLADGSTHEAMFRFPVKSNQATTARRILGGR